MKKILLFVVLAVFSLSMSGCKKKEQAEEGTEPMTMEALSVMTAPQAPATDVKAQGQQAAATQPSTAAATVAQPAQVAAAAKLVPLPPAGPYKPTSMEIQTALKNAGFYTGVVDGKLGPKSKKAIEAFQKANSLQADGKVGPKTWVALSKYLTPAPAPTATPAAPVKIR